MAVQAAIPNAGTSLGVNANYSRELQTQIDAILRKPLLVGYSDGAQGFGWLIGPRFELNNKGKTIFSHIPQTYTVMATIVMPGWWDQLFLTGSQGWLDSDGEPQNTKEMKITPYKVVPDFNCLTTALLDDDSNLTQSPVITRRVDTNKGPQYAVVAGKQEKLIITGKNLWKNPQVFIGSQKADLVEVLPDMNGLVATFNEVNFPGASTDDSTVADLSIFASGGSDTVAKAVKITNLHPLQSDQGFASLVSKFVVKDGKVKFNVKPGKTFPAYASMKLSFRTDKNNAWLECNPVVPDRNGNDFFVQFTPKNAFADTPNLVYVKLSQQPFPGADFIDVNTAEGQTLVYFDSSNQNSLKLATPTLIFPKTGDPTGIAITLPFAAAKDKNDLLRQLYKSTLATDLAPVIIATDANNAVNVQEISGRFDANGNIIVDEKGEIRKLKADRSYNLVLKGKGQEPIAITPELVVSIAK